jgi:hypothetical protein
MPPESDRWRLRPGSPVTLELASTWDGAACPPMGRAVLALSPEGLTITAESCSGPPAGVPDAPPGTRVHDLWRYDVIEFFVAGAGGYLEVELGPDGRFLVLSFGAPRRRTDEHAALTPIRHTERLATGWTTTACIPWPLLPAREPGGIWRVNAFAHTDHQLYAWSPLPGDRPDFHQPERFPTLEVSLPSDVAGEAR